MSVRSKTLILERVRLSEAIQRAKMFGYLVVRGRNSEVIDLYRQMCRRANRPLVYVVRRSRYSTILLECSWPLSQRAMDRIVLLAGGPPDLRMMRRRGVLVIHPYGGYLGGVHRCFDDHVAKILLDWASRSKPGSLDNDTEIWYIESK